MHMPRLLQQLCSTVRARGHLCLTSLQQHSWCNGSSSSSSVRHTNSSSSRSFGSVHSTTSGLFGISRLQSPDDYPRWAAEAVERCDELVQQILPAAPDVSVVRMVDEISDTLCQVYDSAECVRNIHPDASWKRAATTACQTVSTYIAEINHHKGLYTKLLETQAAYRRSAKAASGAQAGNTVEQQQQQHVSDVGQAAGPVLSSQQLSQFCPETLVVIAKYLHDFEKFGIHLPDSRQRARVAELLDLNQHFPARFNANMVDPKKLGTVKVMSQTKWWGTGTSLLGGTTVPLDSGSVHHFLATTSDEDARKQVYLAAARGPCDNLALLDNMLLARHELGTLLGYNSYAAFKAADASLAGTPAAATDFLVALAEGCQQQAGEELALLRKLKRQHTNNSAAEMMPWDQEYYTHQLCMASPYISAQAAATPYLQLNSILQGLDHLLQQLMGLRLQQQPLQPSEAWGFGVLKLHVSCQQKGPLGVLYLDLLVREGKPNANGILYPLRCGRQLADGSYQHPILCLVGNLRASSSNNKSDVGKLLLTWSEFRTLMHEMGHAMHSFVSRTQYQHVWGTRCSQDLVEVPSHLWEHFTGAPRSMAVLAKHSSSRDSMPPHLLHALCSGWSMFTSVTPALELQQQVLLSLIDMEFHGAKLPADRGGSSRIWQQLAQQFSSLPSPKNTCPQTRFGHLTLYGACYYSYLYARCIAEALWVSEFAADPLNPSAGHLIRTSLLEPGGSIDAKQVLLRTFSIDTFKRLSMTADGTGWAPDPANMLLCLKKRSKSYTPA